MKKLNLIILGAFLCMFLGSIQAQQLSDMFYATIETDAALELKREHPADIKIIDSKNGYSVAMLTDNAAHELHHKVLVHGPGFIYELSEKSALLALEEGQIKQKRNTTYAITQEQLVRQSLNLVNNLNIADQIKELENYGTRYHTTNSARQAVLDLKTKWEALAAGRSDISVRIVNHSSTVMPSVVMTMTGTEKPDEFVILGGHADSTAGGSNNNNAPGADDNASGISTITEAARVLLDMNFRPKRTIEFMAFAAEEVGLRGSKEIATDYRNRNVDVISYMQLDMTNYKGSTNDVFISTDSYNDDTLNDFMIELLNYYNASGTHKITYGTSQCNYGCSDHYSWAQQGYDVTFPFEARFGEHNPNIHTTRDTFDRSPTPNATHAAKFCKLALEFLIEISNGVSTGGGGDQCSTSITTFPYQEGFEGSLGSWTQSSVDDLDWTIDASGTPSNGTGPSNASEGSSYLYVEASGNGTGYPGKKAILNSPCFDLTSIPAALLSFKYHMKGGAIGSLSVEISLDNGSTWASLFRKTGAQGNDWNIENINLNPYIGSEIQLRFNVVTGDSWQGDIAIDDLEIKESIVDPNPNVCESLDFNSLTITSFSNQDSAGDSSIVNNGAGVSLQNNSWKYVPLNYNVTSSTVLEFDFSSTAEGEIHAIGFENDNTLTADMYFKVYGTQNYGITNYNDYTRGTKSYTIPVGDYYTGAMDRLVLVNDNDAGSNNNSTFSNIKIYEGSCTRSAVSSVEFGTNIPVIGNEDEETLSMVTITPNPTSDSFVLDVRGDNSKDIRVTIYTILGKKASQLQLSTGANTISAKSLSLRSGIYLIRIESEGAQQVIKKMVIQ